jgi:hypothetical protein
MTTVHKFALWLAFNGTTNVVFTNAGLLIT